MEKIGKYEILKELGAGATSTVYLANDPFGEKQVALKLFKEEVMHDVSTGPAFRKLLRNEASLAGKLIHPHIVHIMDAVMDEDLNYMVMEYVEGETLEKYAEVDHLLPINTVAEIAYKVCKALEYAQTQGVIHRDIKPANILFTGASDIKISDFGAAMIENHEATQISGVGSPAYMSPEQIKEQPLTHQTDIYSLGVTMYKLLTGKLPFDATNNFSMIYQIMNLEPPAPSVWRPEIPSDLDAIVLHAMQKEPNGRYSTWEAFANELVHFFSTEAPASTQIFDTEKFAVLRELAFFKRFSDVELWEVLHFSEWRKVGKDEVIIREGDIGNDFFIIASGTVKVLKGGRLLNLLHKGDCFGEMMVLEEAEAKRTTDITAKTDVTLIDVKPEVLEKASAGCRFKFSDTFLRILVKRLAVANTRISHLLADDSGQ
jgi:eukaryotic-like serine/threonine-protein kinase